MSLVALCIAIAASSCRSSRFTNSNPENSDFDTLLGFDFNEPLDDAQIRVAELLEQEAIAACMLERGFEYAPIVQGTTSTRPTDLPFPSRAFSEVYGFGVSTLALPQDALREGLIGFPGNTSTLVPLDEDPNLALLREMSEGTRNAFYIALYGVEFTDLVDGGSSTSSDQWRTYAASSTGCKPSSERAQSPAQAPIQTFSAELHDLYRRFESDSRVKDFRSRATNCMEGKGFRWADPDTEAAKLEARLQPIIEEFFASQSLSETEISERLENPEFDEDGNLLLTRPGSLQEATGNRLSELQADEIAVAVAAEDCEASLLFERAVLGPVRQEYEQAFVEDNLVALEALAKTE